MPNHPMSKVFAPRIKRVYLPAAADDGRRILVDRLWPRGLSKAEAEIDDWLKDVAPSTDLRRWFGHDPVRWEPFQQRYRAELKDNSAVTALADLVAVQPVTLVYAAHDEDHNHALVLAAYLGEHGKTNS